MPKRKAPTAPSHLLTTDRTLAEHQEHKRQLYGAYKASGQTFAPRNRVDNSAHYIGSKDVSSVARRKAEAAIRNDAEASAWLKQHKWGLKFA